MTDLELYNQAKEAYYNGSPIMTDYEFDELEEKLGLSNKSYIGSKHNPSYTVKHPYMMGSLSKVQIKEENGVIDWQKYYDDVCKYIYKYHTNPNLIITPKYDGCSFEAHFNRGKLTISTRGDGEFGKDIEQYIFRKLKPKHYSLSDGEYTLRGEVLIDKKTFEEKYSEFVNPRSFVSGVIGRDYCDDPEFQAMLDDLSIVIYDVRANNVSGSNGWIDFDWNEFVFDYQPKYFYSLAKIANAKDLQKYYEDFARYRKQCPFALDGIVIKPVAKYRENNTTDERPKDCVAIKFVPNLQETEVIDIEWSVAKNGEMRPVIITKPVVIDGKTITRASAHNYGYLVDNQLSIGCKVILSLAGDIIPFIYKITDTSAWSNNNLAIDLNNQSYQVQGCHLYKIMSDDEISELKFIESANALGIPQIGPAAAKTIYDFIKDNSKGDDFLGIEAREVPNNILLVDSSDIQLALGGKLGSNAAKSFNEFIKHLTITDIIVSCTFDSCGRKVAEQIEKQILFGTGNFEHLALKAYQWALNDSTSKEFQQVYKIIEKRIDINEYKKSYNTSFEDNTIPIIMTGEPNEYKTKGDFLKAHSEYCNTTSWKECKILFTNSLDSTTAKMEKAKKLGIEIKLY